MSDSISHLDLLAVGQSQKEVSANTLFDAASPSMVFGRRSSSTALLTWGYYGGAIVMSGVVSIIPNATIALSANTTNYVEVTNAGVVSRNSVGFTAGRTPLYRVITGATTVTAYYDHRTALVSYLGQGVDDLAAIEALSGTGYAKRTGTNTWVLTTIDEDVDDRVAALLVGAGLVTVTYNDAGGVLTITGTMPAKRVATPVWSSNMTLDWDAYDLYRINMAGDTTFTFTGGSDGQNCQIELKQDATGSRLATWPATARFSSDIASPTVSTIPGATDKLGWQRNTNLNKYDLSAIVKGF
jgi:hypothetical protein